jgi:hypothetical protein
VPFTVCRKYCIIKTFAELKGELYMKDRKLCGHITDDDQSNNKVPIFQSADVSDEDAIAIKTQIQKEYSELTKMQKNSLEEADNFLEIEIVNGTEDSFDEINGVVEIALESESSIAQVFQFIVIPYLT